MSKGVKVSAVLKELGACAPALRWARSWERENPEATIAMMWVACPDAMWIAWIVSELNARRALAYETYSAIYDAWEVVDAASFRRAVGWLHYPAVEAAFLRAARAS